jgi:ABC-2 type transport system permease protein
MAAASVAEATALHVNTDMGGGIIARFRTMAIWRPAVLVGQVAGSVIRTVLTGAAVCAVGVGLGFTVHASILGWVAAAGLFALLGLALSWLTVAFGLIAKTPSGANSLSLIPLLLPFVSSAFVPTDRMPAGVRQFAQYQPFTPIIDSLRGLLVGGPVAGHVPAAVGWCVAIAAVGFWWSARLYDRRPTAATAG